MVKSTTKLSLRQNLLIVHSRRRSKLSGFSAAPVKNEGSAIEYDTAQESMECTLYEHETIAMGFSITEEAIEDNLYDSLSARYTKGSGSCDGVH